MKTFRLLFSMFTLMSHSFNFALKSSNMKNLWLVSLVVFMIYTWRYLMDSRSFEILLWLQESEVEREEAVFHLGSIKRTTRVHKWHCRSLSHMIQAFSNVHHRQDHLQTMLGLQIQLDPYYLLNLYQALSLLVLAKQTSILKFMVSFLHLSLNSDLP